MKKKFITKLSKKGQIVLKKELREKLGIKPGQRLEEEIEDKKIIIKPALDIVEAGGFLKEIGKGKTAEELNKEIDEGWK